MHILSALFFAISSSGDSFIVGLSYGVKNIRITLLNNILVAFISGVGTLSSMVFGKLLLGFIPTYYANIIGSSFLILFGIYMLIKSLKKKPHIEQALSSTLSTSSNHFDDYENILRNPDLLDINNSKNIETNEAFSLGLVLCVNNIGLGLGASIIGLNLLLTFIFTVIASIIFVHLGCYIGRKITSDKLSQYSDLAAALMITILGICELFL